MLTEYPFQVCVSRFGVYRSACHLARYTFREYLTFGRIQICFGAEDLRARRRRDIPA